MQVRRILSHADVGPAATEAYLAGLDQSIVDGVHISWVGSSHWYFMLKFGIDWEAHKAFVANGRGDVHLGAGWSDGIAIEVDAALQLYREYPSATSIALRPGFGMWSDTMTFEALCRRLGLTPGKALKWAKGSAVQESFGIPDLPEASVTVRFVTE